MIGPHVHMGPIKTLPVKPWRYAFIVELGWFDIHTRIANHCGRRAGPRAFKFTRLIIYRRNENHNCDEDDDDYGELIEWNIRLLLRYFAEIWQQDCVKKTDFVCGCVFEVGANKKMG